MKMYKVVSKVETYVEANNEEDAKIEFECENYSVRNEEITEITEVNSKEVIKALFWKNWKIA